MSEADVSSPLDEKSGARKEGEVHEADEEHKHYPTTLESTGEEEDVEEERETLSSLAEAIEQQSTYIKDLIEEIKNLRVELLENKRQSYARKPSKKSESTKKAGKKKSRR